MISYPKRFTMISYTKLIFFDLVNAHSINTIPGYNISLANYINNNNNKTATKKESNENLEF